MRAEQRDVLQNNNGCGLLVHPMQLLVCMAAGPQWCAVLLLPSKFVLAAAFACLKPMSLSYNDKFQSISIGIYATEDAAVTEPLAASLARRRAVYRTRVGINSHLQTNEGVTKAAVVTTYSANVCH